MAGRHRARFTRLQIGLASLGVVAVGSSVAFAGAGAASAATASAPDTAFTYTGSWTGTTGEHYSGSAGASAKINFNVDAGGGTFSLKGTKNGSNKTVSLAIDAGAPVNISESSATQQTGVVVYTSPALAAGAHTATVKVVTPYGSLAGATLSNGSFGGSGYTGQPPAVTASTATLSAGTVTNTSIPVTWALQAGTDGANGVRLSRDGADGGWSGDFASSGSAAFNGLTAGTAYKITAQPIAGTNPVGTPKVITVTTTGGSTPPSDPTPPPSTTASTATLTAGTVTDTSIPVTWSLQAGTDGANGMRLSRDGADGGWTGDFASSGSAPFNGLTAATTYKITAQPIAGTTPVGTPKTITVTTTGAATPPPSGGGGGTTTPPAGWTQTSFEDFNGSSLPSNWYLYGGRSGASNTAFDPSHVSVANGVVTLKAYRDAAYNNEIVGAGFAQRTGSLYGKYEARARLNTAKGVQVAGMLWPEASVWPPEVDFIETNGQYPAARNDTTLHWGSNNNQEGGQTAVDMTQWHTYGVEWEPGRFVFTIDGVVTKTITHTEGIPTQNMLFAFQIESHQFGTGGGYEVAPDSSASNSTFEIDWAASYKRS